MKTVLVSGCYDIIHGGHIQFLYDAAAKGDRLVVAVSGEEVLMQHKGRVSAMPTDHKVAILRALDCVDDVVVTRKAAVKGLDFVPYLSAIQPDILAVTVDDRYAAKKLEICHEWDIEYVQLSKWLGYEPTSTTKIRQRCASPHRVPLRVDFAGGWFDVPRLAERGQFIANCAIDPGLSLDNNWVAPGSGLGGSAAWAILNGKDPIRSELDAGVGWQDPAVIMETGLCVWHSGSRPRLYAKRDSSWLHGKMAVLKRPGQHSTADLARQPRNYDLIRAGGTLACRAILGQDLGALARAIQLTSRSQHEEGMEPLPSRGEIASRYCGSGFGGYALYLFNSESERTEFAELLHAVCIEPFDRWVG